MDGWIAVYPPTGSTAYEMEIMSTPPIRSFGVWPSFTFYLIKEQIHHHHHHNHYHKRTDYGDVKSETTRAPHRKTK